MELSKENELLRYPKGKFVQTKQLCAKLIRKFGNPNLQQGL